MKISHDSLPKAYGYAKLNEQGDKHKGNNSITRNNSGNSRTRDTIVISGAKGATISAHPNTYRNINDLDSSKIVRFDRLKSEESASQTENETTSTVQAAAYKATASATQESAQSGTSDIFELSPHRFRHAQQMAEAKMAYKMQDPNSGITYDNYDEEYEKTLNSVIEMMRGGTFEVKTDIGDINIAKVESDTRKELEKDADFMKQNGLDFELVFKGNVYETISKMTGEDYMNLSVDDYLTDKTIGGKSLPFYVPDENNHGAYKAVDRDSAEAKAYINQLIEERGKANDEYAKYKGLKAITEDSENV